MQPCKPPFERGDGVLEIVAASCEHPREDRISDRGTVGYPGAFLFGGDIAIQKVNGAIEIADRFSLVEVPESAADDVVAALRQTSIKGRSATVRRERYPAR